MNFKLKHSGLSICFIFSAIVGHSQVLKTMKKLPDTGQNTSYTNTFGEDNDYSINVPVFKQVGNGSVLDTITGLVWQMTDGGEMTVENASNYCDTLNLNGKNDWRLPLAAELFSIQNLQNNNPTLNTTYFTKTGAEYWWSSNKQSNDASKVWCTNAGGGIGNHPKAETISAGGIKKFHTRCVRTDVAPKIISQRFLNVGDSSVLDSLTLLEWQIFPVETSKVWEDALLYSENLVLDGHSDWRLPNIKELHSLNDESRVSPSINTSIFKFGVRKFWSSTSLPNQTTKAWYFETNYGITTYELKTNPLYLICVRNHTTTNSVGIQNPTKNRFEIVSENPANQQLEFTLNDAQNCKMIDLLGHIVLDKTLDQTSLNHSIETSQLLDGIYVLIVNTASNQLRKTIVIKH